jgi:hypothetical protein
LTSDHATDATERLKKQLANNPPMKWIYCEQHSECLNRLIQYVLTTNGSKSPEIRQRRFMELFAQLKFSTLYPKVQLDHEKLREHFEDEAKKFDGRRRKAGKVYSLNTLLFVLEKEIADAIPSTALTLGSTHPRVNAHTSC